MFSARSVFEIKGFSPDCPLSYTQKLMSMGFIPGTHFQILKIAPLGDPYQIEIRGYSIYMRQSELNLIEVIKI